MYPNKGSITCCHGLDAFGLLIVIFLLNINDSAQSFRILSFVQSPPPIQLPDRTVTRLNFFSFKKKFTKLLVKTSQHALLPL